MNPNGEPNRRLFVIGMVGGLLGCLMATVSMFAMLFPLNSDNQYWPVHLANSFLFISVILLAFGLRGIHWNYGDERAGYAFGIVLLILLFALIAQIVGFWEYVDASLSNPYAQDENQIVESTGMFTGFIFFSIALMVCTYGLNAGKKYLQPGSGSHGTMTLAIPLILTSSIMLLGFYSVISLKLIANGMVLSEISNTILVIEMVFYLIALIFLAVGLAMLGLTFRKAPMPEVPHNQSKTRPDYQSLAKSATLII